MLSDIIWNGYYVYVAVCAIDTLYPEAKNDAEVFESARRDGLLTAVEIEAYEAWRAQIEK